MRRLSFSIWPAAAVLWLVASAPGTADADVFELGAQVRTGGMWGTGLFGDRKDEAFFDGASGFGYGAQVGVEFLFLDGWIQHDQFVDGSGVHGTWTQFMVGFDFTSELGDEVGATAKAPKSGKGYTSGFVEIGFAIGFGVGTGQQVDPPLDNSELSDQGFMAQFHFDVAHRLTKSLAIGLHLPVDIGYVIRKAPLSPEQQPIANDINNHYGTIAISPMLTLRGDFSLTD